MANSKKISHIGKTGMTYYCAIRREADGYMLDNADGAFKASPVNPYIPLTEHSILKGLYELAESRAVWNNGNYSIFIYKQADASPAPANDTLVGGGPMDILGDLEVLPGTYLNSIVEDTGTTLPALIASGSAPTADENAAAIWAYTSRTLTGVTGTISWPVISNAIKQDYIDAITSLVSGDLPLGETEKIFAIDKAIQSYSLLRPRLIAEDEDGTGSADYLITLLADWIDGFSAIKTVEYPVDDNDEEGTNILPEDSWKIYQKPTGKYLRFTENKPSTTEDFRVVYTAMHRCTDEACTIPLIDEGAVQLLAAANYCDMLATYYAQTSDSTIMADSVDHKSKAAEYGARARAYRTEYKNHMGIKEGNTVGAASVTKDQDVKPSWKTDNLTHPRKYR